MIYEISVELSCPGMDIITENDELMTLPEFIAAQVKDPNYIIGNFVSVTDDGVSFSARYVLESARTDIVAFIALVKPYSSGRVSVHVCRHDTGESCDASKIIDEWGV